MTLAEAFETKCRRMKDRLAAERQKFSKSLRKEHLKSEDIGVHKEKEEIVPFRPVKFDIPVPPRKEKKKTSSKHVRTVEDKENMGDTNNRRQGNRDSQKEHRNMSFQNIPKPKEPVPAQKATI